MDREGYDCTGGVRQSRLRYLAPVGRTHPAAIFSERLRTQNINRYWGAGVARSRAAQTAERPVSTAVDRILRFRRTYLVSVLHSVVAIAGAFRSAELFRHRWSGEITGSR